MQTHRERQRDIETERQRERQMDGIDAFPQTPTIGLYFSPVLYCTPPNHIHRVVLWYSSIAWGIVPYVFIPSEQLVKSKITACNVLFEYK